MNWKFLIIAIVIIEFIYDIILEIIRYRSTQNPTPQNVADIFDNETYLRWKQYSADKCKLGMLASSLTTALMLTLLLTESYAAIVRLFPQNPFSQLFSVILLHTLLSELVDSFIKYINIMIIEEEYDFNRTSVKTFVTDRIRNLLLNLLFSTIIAYYIYDIHSTSGDWMIIEFSLAIALGVLLMSIFYPFFSRIGNKFTPLENCELKDKLMALLTRHGYKVKAIMIMDASRRTTKLNAYFTGLGKTKTIVLFDNLVNTLNEDEICAVFAHEMGHGLHKDVPKQQTMNFFNLLLMAVVAWLVVRYPVLHTSFGFSGVNYGFAYLLIFIGLGLVFPLTRIVKSAYSRRAEYRADYQAVAEGYGRAMISALKKMGKSNFEHLAPSKLLVTLEYSHPPLSERIGAIEKQLY